MKLNSKRDIIREICKAVYGKDERPIVKANLEIHFRGTLLGIGDDYVNIVANDYPSSDRSKTLADVQSQIINTLISLYYLADDYDTACV